MNMRHLYKKPAKRTSTRAIFNRPIDYNTTHTPHTTTLLYTILQTDFATSQNDYLHT